MKKILGLAALAALVMAAPAYAQRGSHGGGHAGGGFARDGGSHFGGGGFGSGRFGGGNRFGGGYRGGYRGGYGGYYGGPSLYFGFGGYYPSYYGAPYYGPSPYYGYPYGAAPYSYSYSEDLDEDDDAPDAVAQRPAPQEGDWRVTRRAGETDFELPDSVLFALDSATISHDADAVLKEIADAAKEQPHAHLIVEGHTDTSGTKEHNQELSDARARAVATVLARAGVARDRVTTEGLGESALAVQTGDEVREPRNRRVVIRLIAARETARSERMDAAPDAPAPKSGNRP